MFLATVESRAAQPFYHRKPANPAERRHHTRDQLDRSQNEGMRRNQCCGVKHTARDIAPALTLFRGENAAAI
jgi:hypothetical protein